MIAPSNSDYGTPKSASSGSGLLWTDGRHRRRGRSRRPPADRGGRPRRPLRARQARADRAAGQGAALRPGHERHRGAHPGTRLLRRPADQQGQDARRPARHRHRRRALARHRARGAAGAVRQPAPRRGGLAGRAAQAHAPAGAALARRARTRRRPWAARSAPSTPTARAQLGGADVLLVATDLGVDVVCAAEDAERVRGALDVPVVPEAAAEVLRVESGRPRYGLDLDDAHHPPGGRPQRARGELHQGLLRRPGDGRAPALPAASPTATCAGCGSRRRCPRARRWCSASARSGGSARAWCRRASVRSGWRWCGARRRWATSSSRARRSRSSLSCRSGRSALCGAALRLQHHRGEAGPRRPSRRVRGRPARAGSWLRRYRCVVRRWPRRPRRSKSAPSATRIDTRRQAAAGARGARLLPSVML